MKIVVISDIHGNLSCLDYLSRQEDFRNADVVYALGDIVVDYSHPNECIEFVNKYTHPVIGNNDFYVCNHIPTRGMASFKNRKIAQITFMGTQISEENKRIVNSWPKYEYLNVDGIKFAFCHYLWELEDDCIVDGGKPCLEDREKLFASIDADYIFFGHEHDSNNFTNGKKHFYCTSSLGLKNPSRYYVINVNDGHVDVKEKMFLHDFDIENKEEYDLIRTNKDFFEKFSL